MTILGISCYYHESASALIKDGVIVAASAEERFTRLKHDWSFPDKSIEFCLQKGKIKPQDLDYVVFYEKPFVKFERNLTLSLKHFPYTYSLFGNAMFNLLSEKLWIKSKIAETFSIAPSKILFVPHHVSHASASYYISPFKRAAFLTLDGVGEWTTGSNGIGIESKLYPAKEMRFPNSVGMLYSTFTAFLGFEVNDGEYKVMGMAGYGKSRYISKIRRIFRQNNDGSIDLNFDYFEFHKSTKRMYSKKFIKEFEKCDRFDLVASIQQVTGDIVLKMVDVLYKKTKEKNLVYGGGVALNSVINARILKTSKFNDVFIFPAAGDDGGAAGAALYIYHHILGFKKRSILQDVFLGPSFNNYSVEKYLKSKKVHFVKMSDKKLNEFIASKLNEGKVVGLFEGASEFGPRALGHRSILADPRNPKMKDIINAKIKFREEFRPFAPAVLSEYAKEYFLDSENNLSKFMLGTFKVKMLTRKKVPAIVHVDGTSRVQIVEKKYIGKLRKILESFYKKTTVPILLNTSFNIKGEPIVNSPAHAYETFIDSGIDILVLENCVVSK